MVDEQKQPDEPETPPASEPVNERLRRGLFWALEYWRELFNFRFDKYMIIQVIPGVYGVALTAIGLGLVYLCAEAFMLLLLFVGKHWLLVGILNRLTPPLHLLRVQTPPSAISAEFGGV